MILFIAVKLNVMGITTRSFLLTVTQDLIIIPSKNHFLMLVLDLKWWQYWDILISYHLKTYFWLFQLKSFCRSIMSNLQKATLNAFICPYLNENPKLMPQFFPYMNCKFNIKDIFKQKFLKLIKNIFIFKLSFRPD